MKKSIIIWSPNKSDNDYIRKLEDDGFTLGPYRIEPDIYDDRHYISEWPFVRCNYSKFRDDCSYQILVLFYDGVSLNEVLGLKITYECSDDDYMVRVLEYGENFFYIEDEE